MNIREKVLSALSESFEKKKYANIETDIFLKKNDFSENDKAFFTALFLGVIERKITIDYIISRFSSIPRNELENDALIILEMGIYQILYMQKIPDSAAVNESVILASKYAPNAKGYINAILRNISANKGAIPQMLEFPGKKGLSLKYSYPKWLAKLWMDSYGAEACEMIMQAQNSPMPLSIKVNETKISIEEYKNKLYESGIEFRSSEISKKAILIDNIKNPRKLYGFDDGLFFVQDAGFQYIIEKAAPKSGMNILDICASPGGKSFAAAVEMQNKGKIISNDLYPQRVEIIEKGIQKFGFDIIEAYVSDAMAYNKEYDSAFDMVICDVPCSGYGVIAKKPDIRLKGENDSALLPAIQAAILNNASKYLKCGGKLIYSTCTLSPFENENITDAFLAEKSEYKRVEKSTTIFPKANEHDGFFADIIERIK